MSNIERPVGRKLIDAGLAHLALERAVACVLPVPETDPPLFVAVGRAPAIVKLLQDEQSVAGAPIEPPLYQFGANGKGPVTLLNWPTPEERERILAAQSQEERQAGVARALRTAQDALQFLATNPELSDPHQIAKGALKAVERAECGPRVKAALQELADIAQENDMGYGAPEKATADVEFDESEGGHHD